MESVQQRGIKTMHQQGNIKTTIKETKITIKGETTTNLIHKEVSMKIIPTKTIIKLNNSQYETEAETNIFKKDITQGEINNIEKEALTIKTTISFM